jgi:hypothetical protein
LSLPPPYLFPQHYCFGIYFGQDLLCRGRPNLKFFLLAGLLVLAAQSLHGAPGPALTPSPTRWAIDAGYGFRLWDASGGSSEQQAYEEKAKQGWVLGGDVAVFPLRNFGIGFAYYRFLSSTSDDDYGFYDGTRGQSTDSYLIEYVGPSLYYKREFSRITALAQLGAGVIYYDNQHEAEDFPGVLQGVEAGFFGSVSADYKIWHWFGIGLTTRVLYGKLDELDYNGINTPFPAVSLTRIDVAAGIRFYP